ncbi:NAD(P)/FAD-dependent oxidoreductase [Aurantivibrio plasticivorans]
MTDLNSKPLNVAIIGAGVSGLTVAYLLRQHGGKTASGQDRFNIRVFEEDTRIGGHTATIPVDVNGETLHVDTGFIVYNDWTYPNFIQLLTELGVENQPTDMTFSVSCQDTGLEYSGENLNTLFAQRKNLLSYQYWVMLSNILRFNKQAVADLDNGQIDPGTTLGEYLHKNNYSGLFTSHYLVPMCAAIWSASHDMVMKMPLLFFVKFFKNHGLLSVNNRPQWRVIKGGSSQYLRPLTQQFSDCIVTASSIESVSRTEGKVKILFKGGNVETFDHVILACHSDQAIKLLHDISKEESEILASIPYKDNSVVLHTDESILPNNRKTWAAWNYHLSSKRQDAAILTYNMNILQGFDQPKTYCVTLNADEKIDPNQVIGKFNYAHPSFSMDSVLAQSRWSDINGVNNTWFCGAYWGNGFHEDGVVSAKRVAKALGVDWN